MSLKKITILITTIFLSGGLAFCGGEKKPEAKPQQAKAKSYSKVVVVDKTQFAFDLMPMKMFKAMMKDMGTELAGPADANYAVMVTLMEKPDNKLVKNAKVNLRVKTGDKTEKISAEVIQGAGMYHYGTSLKLPKGEVKVKAVAKMGSKKSQAKAKFTIE